MSYGNTGNFDASGRPIGQNPNSPYGNGSQPTPPAKSKAIWWILGILGFVLVSGAVVCCGGGYLAFQAATGVVANQVKDAVANDPAIQEHIGTINNASMNLSATSAAGGANKLVLDVQGDKGSGQLEVVVNNQTQPPTLESCVLVLPTGDRHELELQLPGQTINAPEPELSPNEEPATEQPDPTTN